MTDDELDELYDTANLLMKKGRWSLIDDLLEYYATAAWRMDVNLLLGWATATLPAKGKLRNRGRFIKECKNFHKEIGFWDGLE